MLLSGGSSSSSSIRDSYPYTKYSSIYAHFPLYPAFLRAGAYPPIALPSPLFDSSQKLIHGRSHMIVLDGIPYGLPMQITMIHCNFSGRWFPYKIGLLHARFQT